MKASKSFGCIDLNPDVPSGQFDSLGIEIQDIIEIINEKSSYGDSFDITDIKDIIDTAFHTQENKDDGKIQQNLSDFFEGTQAENDILEEMPSLGTTGEITKKALIKMFKRLAKDDGYNSQLSLKELTREDNWEQLVRFNMVGKDIKNKPTDGVINYVSIGTEQMLESYDDHDFSIDADGDLNFTRLKKGKIEQKIEFKTSNPDEYKVIKIPGDKQNRTITVAVDAAETVESLMNNSDLYKQAIIRTLDNTGYNSFYILDSDGLGYDEGGGKAIGADDNAAIFSLNIDDYNKGDKAWSDEEKQTMAKTLIHEVGHLAGGLGERGTEYELYSGDHTHPEHGSNKNFHGLLHSNYVMDVASEWLANTGKKPAINWEEVDRSTNTFQDRTIVLNDKGGYKDDGVFDTKINGANSDDPQNIGEAFYKIQDALIKNDFETVTDLLYLLDDTKFDRSYYTRHEGAGKKTLKDYSARQYVTELLLYETIDKTTLGGFDAQRRIKSSSKEGKLLQKEERKEIGTYGDDNNAKKYNVDGFLGKTLQQYLEHIKDQDIRQTIEESAFFSAFKAKYMTPQSRS